MTKSSFLQIVVKDTILADAEDVQIQSRIHSQSHTTMQNFQICNDRYRRRETSIEK